MVHRRVGIKGLKSIWKNRDETFTQSIYSGTKQTHFQWQCFFSGMEWSQHFRDETYGDVKMLEYNILGRTVWGRNVRGCNIPGCDILVPFLKISILIGSLGLLLGVVHCSLYPRARLRKKWRKREPIFLVWPRGSSEERLGFNFRVYPGILNISGADGWHMVG
jgi:hypothetical protein